MLFDEELTILNSTGIQYRYLTIPCCRKCNNEDLARMESAFQSLLDRGFSGMSDKDEMVVFQWTAKLLYGTLYKELSLLVDRQDPQQGTITSPELIENFSTLHLFLQSIRIDTEFRPPVPWSLFAFGYADNSFNYFNDIEHLCLSIKLGHLGITIAFEDNNIVARMLRRLKGLYRFELTSNMFWEVSARVFYAKRLLLRTPFYITSFHEPTQRMYVVAMDLPARPFDKEEFAGFFGSILHSVGIKLDRPMYENGNVATLLFDQQKGAYIDLIIEDEPDE